MASKKDLELEKAKKIYDKFMEEQAAEDEREEEEYFKLVKSNMDKLQLEHELRYKKLKAEEELTHMLLKQQLKKELAEKGKTSYGGKKRTIKNKKKTYRKKRTIKKIKKNNKK